MVSNERSLNDLKCASPQNSTLANALSLAIRTFYLLISIEILSAKSLKSSAASNDLLKVIYNKRINGCFLGPTKSFQKILPQKSYYLRNGRRKSRFRTMMNRQNCWTMTRHCSMSFLKMIHSRIPNSCLRNYRSYDPTNQIRFRSLRTMMNCFCCSTSWPMSRHYSTSFLKMIHSWIPSSCLRNCRSYAPTKQSRAHSSRVMLSCSCRWTY